MNKLLAAIAMLLLPFAALADDGFSLDDLNGKLSDLKDRLSADAGLAAMATITPHPEKMSLGVGAGFETENGKVGGAIGLFVPVVPGSAGVGAKVAATTGGEFILGASFNLYLN